MRLRNTFNEKTFLISVFLLLTGNFTLLQAQVGAIRNLRYDDDFSYLKSDSTVKRGTENLKYISLSKQGYLNVSIGGEIREWYEYRKNPNFGDLSPNEIVDNNGALQHRFMLHANLEINKNLRIFTQLNNTLEFGNPNPPIPEIIVDGLGLHQFFIEYTFSKKERPSKNLIRIGRQEYSFGNELIISSREGPNNRQPFDGITFIKKSANNQLQILAATPVIINPKVFDNTHTQEALWGAYASLRNQKKNHLDLYYFGFYSERKQYNYIAGTQNRHTFGTRLWNHGHSFFYDVETMYQTGKFNDLTINAFNFTGEVRYIFQDATWKPMIGFGASYISGDYDNNDSQLNTYDPLYPKPIYGLATPQGPSNITHLKPTFGVQPTNRLYINFRWYWLARSSKYDGTYTPGMVQVRPAPNVVSEYYGVGTQYNLDTFYIINKNLSFITFISIVKPGNYIKDTGMGKTVFYWSSALQYKF